LSLKG